MWRWLGCVVPGPFGSHEPAPSLEPPRIASLSVDCDPDLGSWTLEVVATAWTGGGLSLWSEDRLYVEQHSVAVTESAPEGGQESLVLTLGIVGDWRAQAPKVSTVFTCADQPSVAFVLYDTRGEPADCQATGPDAEETASLLEGCSLGEMAARSGHR